MKVYGAIGHFKWSENITFIAYADNTKQNFTESCRKNEFVPFVVFTEKSLEKALSADCFELYEQVKKMTTNYRVWNDVTDYIEECADTINEKWEAAREEIA